MLSAYQIVNANSLQDYICKQIANVSSDSQEGCLMI